MLFGRDLDFIVDFVSEGLNPIDVNPPECKAVDTAVARAFTVIPRTWGMVGR